MPTRKQRKRMQKERRHEYETVWVDGDGNELEEPPDDVPSPTRERRSDSKKPQQKSPQQKRPQQRSSRERPTPLPPSWRRAIRRALILGAVILVFSSLLQGLVRGLVFGVIYTLLFIPFTYGLDRFAYQRWQRKMSEQSKKR